jgi:hypothetical protein
VGEETWVYSGIDCYLLIRTAVSTDLRIIQVEAEFPGTRRWTGTSDIVECWSIEQGIDLTIPTRQVQCSTRLTSVAKGASAGADDLVVRTVTNFIWVCLAAALLSESVTILENELECAIIDRRLQLLLLLLLMSVGFLQQLKEVIFVFESAQVTLCSIHQDEAEQRVPYDDIHVETHLILWLLLLRLFGQAAESLMGLIAHLQRIA